MNRSQKLNDGIQAVYVGNDIFFFQKFGKHLEQYKEKVQTLGEENCLKHDLYK